MQARLSSRMSPFPFPTLILCFLQWLAFPETVQSFEEMSRIALERSMIGDIHAAPGTAKEYGKGRCTLCHAFKKTTKSHYFIGPNLGGVTDRANERLRDPNYHRGHPKARKTVIKEAYPGSGTATNALEYLAESLLCVSCYVVPGYGIPGTYDQVSPEIDVTQPPYNLRLDDLAAVIRWLYLNDGKTLPPRDQIDAALFRFLTPLDKSRLQSTPDSLPVQDRTVLAIGTESVSELFGRPQCIVCHVIPGLPEATGSIGPALTMRSLAEQRLKDPTYRGAAHTPRDYVVESILDPSRYLPFEYPDVMPAVYNAKLTPLAINRMADYLLASDDEQAAMCVTEERVIPPPFFPAYQLASPLRLHDLYASFYAQLLAVAGEDPLLDVFDSRREILRLVWSRSQHHKMVVRVDATKSEIRLTAKEIGGWNTEKEPFQLR